MLSAEGLITMQRVTLDGTKIKANASGATSFAGRTRSKLIWHWPEGQVQKDERTGRRGGKDGSYLSMAARNAASARQRESRLEAAWREVERLQEVKRDDRGKYTARASGTDPEAHVMRNGEGGTVPSYNVQLLTDTVPRADRECRSYDRRHRLSPSGIGASTGVEQNWGTLTKTIGS